MDANCTLKNQKKWFFSLVFERYKMVFVYIFYLSDGFVHSFDTQFHMYCINSYCMIYTRSTLILYLLVCYHSKRHWIDCLMKEIYFGFIHHSLWHMELYQYDDVGETKNNINCKVIDMCSSHLLVKRSIGSTTSCTITEKAPTRAFSWLKAPTSAFTFQTLLRHYAERALTQR